MHLVIAWAQFCSKFSCLQLVPFLFRNKQAKWMMEETTKCMWSDLLLCYKLQRKQWWKMRLANLQKSIYSFSRETWVVLNFEEVKDSHSFEYYSIWRMIWLLFNSVCDTHSTVFCGQQNLQPCNQSVWIPHWKKLLGLCNIGEENDTNWRVRLSTSTVFCGLLR
jgi:hypothetical protein